MRAVERAVEVIAGVDRIAFYAGHAPDHPAPYSITEESAAKIAQALIAAGFHDGPKLSDVDWRCTSQNTAPIPGMDGITKRCTRHAEHSERHLWIEAVNAGGTRIIAEWSDDDRVDVREWSPLSHAVLDAADEQAAAHHKGRWLRSIAKDTQYDPCPCGVCVAVRACRAVSP